MKLLFLTENNLRDRLFVQNFVHNYKLKDKAILILDGFADSVRDTRFVTKRISTLLSEEMVYNNAFGADQRGFFKEGPDGLILRTDLIQQLLQPIQLLIFGAILAGPKLADPLALIAAARAQLPIEEVLVFTENPMSPLGAKQSLITAPVDIEPLLKVYEEERESLKLALELSPARLVGPMSYGPM